MRPTTAWDTRADRRAVDRLRDLRKRDRDLVIFCVVSNFVGYQYFTGYMKKSYVRKCIKSHVVVL